MKTAFIILFLFAASCGENVPPSIEGGTARYSINSDGYATVLTAPPSQINPEYIRSPTPVIYEAQQSENERPQIDLDDLRDKISKAMQATGGPPYSLHVDRKAGRVELEVGMDIGQARDLEVFDDFWTMPRLRMHFNAPLVPAEAVALSLRELIKVFPRAKYRPLSLSLLERRTGILQLRDGCFFMKDHLVLFPDVAGLDQDQDGYLVITNRAALQGLQARVGEHAKWSWEAISTDTEAVVSDLKEHCGDHPVIFIGTPVPSGEAGPKPNDLP